MPQRNNATRCKQLTTNPARGISDAKQPASGYIEEELIGQPHNMVRHPDMPTQPYADMWKYLQGGRSWTGMLKNRCKNGDFYWVLAYTAPCGRTAKSSASPRSA